LEKEMGKIGRTAILGCGNIGAAIARGLVRSELIDPQDVVGCDCFEATLDQLAQELGISVSTKSDEVVKDVSNVILAVKPHLVGEVLSSLRGSLGKGQDQLVISVAAGVSLDTIKRSVPKGVRAARVMPNLPITVGAGCCGVFAESGDDNQRVCEIFSTLGVALAVAKEADLDAVTGLAGSGPGFVFLLIEALQQGGVAAGLTAQDAHKFAAQTVLGAAAMVLETGEHPAVLRDRVTTAGGTTIAGIEALEAGGVRSALMDAVIVAAERAREIGEQMARQ
jgi:pyrroline-5-carboxylate reductase